MLFRRACLFVLFASVSVISRAQIVETKNQFVAGDVEAATGILTIRDVVNGKAKDYLTNPGHSFLSLSVNGRWYTNNNVGGQNLVGSLGGGGSAVTPVPIDGCTTQMIQDTIQTTYHDQSGTFDIVQEVYPVSFRASGQIVLRVKIVNRSNSTLTVEGIQYLNDLQANTNDNPFLLERNYYDGNHWRVASKDGTNPNPPSFYIEVEHDPLSLNLGSMGAGFTNDSFPPSPMGLTPCSGFAVGSWQLPAPNQMLDYLFGCPAPPAPNVTSDLACALQWKPTNVPAARSGSDTTIEEFRTSFGTQEFCMCLGNAIAINIFPTHLIFDQNSRTGAPNPFAALSLIFNIAGNDFTNVKVTHSVSAPLQITRGGSIGSGGLSSIYSGSTIKPGQMQVFLWIDSTTQYPGDTVGMNFDMTATGYSGTWDCAHGNCDVMIDPAYAIVSKPIVKTIEQYGSFDGSACNAKLSTIQAYDTGGSEVVTVHQDTSYNLIVPGTITPSRLVGFTVYVIDSMYDGLAAFSISDTDGAVTRDTLRYCTIPDTHFPKITFPKNWDPGEVVTITDSVPWDRGVKVVIYDDPKLNQVDTFYPSASWTGIIKIANPSTSPNLSKTICFHAIDRVGHETDTCFAISAPNEIIDRDQLANVSISPNPSNNYITIMVPHGAAQGATLQNLLGRTVLKQTIHGAGELDISKLAPGTYILRVGGVTRKIIKE